MADKISPCGGTDHDPKRPENRAGLSALDYRITTQPEAFGRMTWKLPRQRVTDPDTKAVLEPLERLRTRDLSDPTISLIDAWAMASDVLAFYSERVANEGFIGTATQRRSVLELARMIGYELAPGVAASAHLAFTVEDADDPYRVVQVASGVQAMSIPSKKDEMPQIFETVEEITARAEWNDINARRERPQNLVLFHETPAEGDEENPKNGTLYLFDLDGSFDEAALNDPDLVTITAESELAPYHPLVRDLDLPAALAKRIEDSATNTEIEPVLHALPVDEVYLTGLGLNLTPGTRILAVAQAPADGAKVTAMPLRVVSASEDRAFSITRVVLTRNGEAPEKTRRVPRLRLPMLRIGRMPQTRVTLDTNAITTHVRGAVWSGDGLNALVRSQAWPRARMMTLIRRVLIPLRRPVEDEVALGLHVMRDSSGFYGSTAQDWATLNYGDKANGTPDKGPYTNTWETNTVWLNGKREVLTGASHAYLDREIKTLQPNSWAILENSDGAATGLRVTGAALESRADYAISGKATGVAFRAPDGSAIERNPTQPSIYNSFKFRSAQLYAVSQLTPLSGVPLPEEMEQGVASVELDGLYLDLERGRPVSLSGARRDAEGIMGRETHIISEIQHVDGVTRLLLQGATAYPYDRATVRINANVALATHGERVEEDLGSGDARLTFQTFTLKKPPLTFVSAANETGRASTLEIRVDGMLWEEIGGLGLAGAEDAVYEVKREDDGTTRVRFGDGRTGRRLPSGELNIKAVYRSGIGLKGEVAAEAISQLKTRPLGVRAVVNPSPATGSADPESLDLARMNAPATVKTLGRIVSLTDYEDFAAAFAGVGKAQARELWSGQEKLVHLSIAPEADGELEESDTLMVNLVAAIEKVRDPARPVIVQPYQRRLFAMTAHLDIDPAYLAEDVILWARAVLEERFGYDARLLAQSVSAAEVIAALHAAKGVVSADLDALAILMDGSTVETTGATLQSVLPALPALGPGQRGTGDTFTAAELLTVLPSAITISVNEAAHA